MSTFQINIDHLRIVIYFPIPHHGIGYILDLLSPKHNVVSPFFYSSFVSNSFSGYEIQSLKLPGYNFTLLNPAIFSAKKLEHAEIPEPHETMISSSSFK